MMIPSDKHVDVDIEQPTDPTSSSTSSQSQSSETPLSLASFENDETDNNNSKNKDPTPFVFTVLTSPWYNVYLKTAQYLSCVSLALILFVDEFFFAPNNNETSFWALHTLYYATVAVPHLLLHLPIFYIDFFRRLPSHHVRGVVWSCHAKAIWQEGLLLILLVLPLPLAIYYTSTIEKDTGNTGMRWIAISGATFSVIYYFMTITSFRHYKRDVLHSRNKNDNSLWAQALKEHQELLREKEKAVGRSGDANRIFWGLMARFPASSAVAWVSVGLYTACLPLQGLTVGYITQAVAEATPTSSFWSLFLPGLYFLLASAGMAIFLWTTKLGFAAFGAHVEEHYRLLMTRSVCDVGPGRQHTVAATLDAGDLASRYSRDLALISNFIDKNKLFTSSGILLSSIVVLFTVDWRMGYFFLIICPALIIMLAEKPGEAHKAGTLAAARLQGRFDNCVELRRTMDLYNAGDYVYAKSAEKMKNDMQAISHSKWVAGNFVAVVHATGLMYTSLISLAFILFSIPLARNNPALAVNHLSAALVILSQLKSPFSQIGQGVEHWLSIAPALFRLDQFSTTSSSKKNKNKIDGDDDASQALQSPSVAINKTLEFNDIHFQYSENAPDVLCGVNASLETGQYTCIVGGSGAGKSTLLNILTRELTPTTGSILVDGQPLAVDWMDISGGSNTTSKYREQIAIVFQSATFLDGTIADNIRMGMPSATDEQVAMAAERAQCGFLNNLPEGLNTMLGGNFNLSGGQGQRVCLARALCRNPKLLILDESTSALDPATEEEAVKTFVDLAHNHNVAVVSVTHRLDTTLPSDKVIVLKDGVVAEEGTPSQLYGKEGLYYEMRRPDNGRNKKHE